MCTHSPNTDPGYVPLFQTTREQFAESTDYGAIAVVTADGNLYAYAGDPELATFLRSSAKPFQAVPLVEMGGLERFQISGKELALICASHSSTDTHLKTVFNLQLRTGILESDLLCCSHPPFDQGSREKLRDQGATPTPNYHNCSGKHTGMLIQAALLNASKEQYTEIDHPVQQQILGVFSDFCGMEPSEVKVARDGCSVPTFAVPLSRAAWAWARLVQPADLPASRRQACEHITRAMGENPFYVAGPGRLDTRLMEILPGKIISKAGAEAFQAAGIFQGALQPDSPALGIAIKIASGDLGKRAGNAVLIETLRQLGLLRDKDLDSLSDLGPIHDYSNQCGIWIGQGKPCFQLQYV